MSEEPGQYITDAMEMLGAGYDHDNRPPVEISPPHRILEGGKEGLTRKQRGGWIKLSTSFLEVMHELKGAKLALYICLALHIDENNECFPGLETIAARTGYSRREVISSLQELEAAGFLSVTHGVKKSNLYTITAGVARGAENAPVQFTTGGSAIYDTENPQNVLKTAPEVESLSRPISREKTQKQVDIVDGYLATTLSPKAKARNEMVARMERALRVSILDPDDKRWKPLIAHCLERDEQSETVEGYARWMRDNPYAAPKTAQIAQRPAIIVETWPAAFVSVEVEPEQYDEPPPLPEKGAPPPPELFKATMEKINAIRNRTDSPSA